MVDMFMEGCRLSRQQGDKLLKQQQVKKDNVMGDIVALYQLKNKYDVGKIDFDEFKILGRQRKNLWLILIIYEGVYYE